MASVLVVAGVRTMPRVFVVRARAGRPMLIVTGMTGRRTWSSAQFRRVRGYMPMVGAMTMSGSGRVVLMGTVRAVIIVGSHGEFLRDDQ